MRDKGGDAIVLVFDLRYGFLALTDAFSFPRWACGGCVACSSPKVCSPPRSLPPHPMIFATYISWEGVGDDGLPISSQRVNVEHFTGRVGAHSSQISRHLHETDPDNSGHSDYSRPSDTGSKTKTPHIDIFVISFPFPLFPFQADFSMRRPFPASAHAQSRASLHISRHGKRLSGQERYGCENNPALAATRTPHAKLYWREAEACPS